MNSERQEIEKLVREEAEQQVGASRILVLAGESWHKGVLGLTAGRIAQKYHRPTLVIGIEGERCSGSARSIPSINLHEQLERAADLFTHFGGHDYACGFSLERRNLEPLRARLAAQFDALDGSLFRREARVDAALPLASFNAEFVAAHETL